MQRSTNVTTGGGGGVDRSRNIVFYGVAENRDPTLGVMSYFVAWNQLLDE